ncbi:class F sortase [Candidatus Saccharibacteria bacterium]|nr:class F sortase [Candidatus Saccharibacteria bacterium]
MSLRIKGWRRIATWVFWGLVALFLLIFLIRVISFENAYYDEKEGSERAVAEAADEPPELDETEPTEEAIKDYNVAPDRPRYLTIDKLGVKNARVLPMGVNSKGELDTPRNIFDVGWYEGSSKPGQGGTMIIDGHNGGPTKTGVFKRLPDLMAGDILQIERGDGVLFEYSVVESVSISLNDSDSYMAKAAQSPEEGIESLTLISCTGEWSQSRQTYLSRQFVRAVLVLE